MAIDSEKNSDDSAPGAVMESELAKRLGVRRAVLRDMRAGTMEEGLHWVRDRQAIVYTEAGLAAVQAGMIGMDDGAADLPVEAEAAEPVGMGKGKEDDGAPVPPAEKKSPGFFDGPPEALWRTWTKGATTMVRIRRVLANPHVLEGELQDRENTVVRLRVKPSKLWRRGMLLPCVQLSADYFEYCGRPPRSWGRW